MGQKQIYSELNKNIDRSRAWTQWSSTLAAPSEDSGSPTWQFHVSVNSISRELCASCDNYRLLRAYDAHAYTQTHVHTK